MRVLLRLMSAWCVHKTIEVRCFRLRVDTAIERDDDDDDDDGVSAEYREDSDEDDDYEYREDSDEDDGKILGSSPKSVMSTSPGREYGGRSYDTARDSNFSSQKKNNILMKEFRQLAVNGMYDVEAVDDNLFKWRVSFSGQDCPVSRMYRDVVVYNMLFEFPTDYPNMPPVVKFLNPMWHPNIYEDGNICISILHAPGEDEFNSQESSETRWRPVHNVQSIITSVMTMLDNPNIDSPANIDAGKELRDDPEAFKLKVQKIMSGEVQQREARTQMSGSEEEKVNG